MSQKPKSYGVGHFFGVPLGDGTFANGLITHALPKARRGGTIGSFFAQRWTAPPAIQELEQITPDNAIWVTSFSDQGLFKGDWPVLGQLPDWNPTDWPLSQFHKFEDRENRVALFELDPKNYLDEIFAGYAPAEKAFVLPKNGMSGYLSVPTVMKILLELSDEGLTPREVRMFANSMGRWEGLPEKYQGIPIVQHVIWLKSQPPRPLPDTPQKVTVATQKVSGDVPKFASLKDEEFWNLIRTGRDNASGCNGQVDALIEILSRRPKAEIASFHVALIERLNRLHRWDLWAVAYIALGGCSDDAFLYFRCWVVCQGQEAFESSLLDVTSVVDRIDTRSEPECEQLLSVAERAYETKTGLPLPKVDVSLADTATGTPWNGDEVESLYPDLAARFR